MSDDYSHYSTDAYAMPRMLEEQDTVSALQEFIVCPDVIGTNTYHSK